MPVVAGGPQIQAILQDNTLQRSFKEALFPELMFRKEAMAEVFEGKTGETKIRTRTGLLAVNLVALVPGADPLASTYGVEQWSVNPSQHSGSVDTNMATSRAALASKFIEDAQKVGLNAGQTLNRLTRNALYRAYTQGHTNATVIQAIGAVAIHVASINGFTDSIVLGEVTAVSAANPAGITFGGAEPANSVSAATPDNAAAPFGPGWLTLTAALTAGIAAREAVLADDRPQVYRVGGGLSVDALGAADILTLQDFTNAVAILQGDNVPNHANGAYHAHLDPVAQAQVFNDNQWQRLHDSLPDHVEYRDFIMGRKVGVDYMKNTVCPNVNNVGALVASGAGLSTNSNEIGADMVNNLGVQVGRVIITGSDVITEDYIPEGEYISEAGVTGKIGNFNITSNGAYVDTDRIRYTMRAPLDKLQQIVAQTWSWSGDFGVPSDVTSGGAARRKRAIILEFARG